MNIAVTEEPWLFLVTGLTTCVADTIPLEVWLCGMFSSYHHVQLRGGERDSYDGDTSVVATEDEEYIMYPEIRQAAERGLCGN